MGHVRRREHQDSPTGRSGHPIPDPAGNAAALGLRHSLYILLVVRGDGIKWGPPSRDAECVTVAQTIDVVRTVLGDL
jgi:hypothetical protein